MEEETNKTIRVRATVPQITFNVVELEMPEELYELGCQEETSQFVWDSLTQTERDWCPNGLKGYRDALEVDYSTIKKL